MTTKEYQEKVLKVLEDIRMLQINLLELIQGDKRKNVPFPYEGALPADYKKNLGLRSQAEIDRLNQILNLPPDLQTQLLEMIDGTKTDEQRSGENGDEGTDSGN